jgi:hypothetical protein
MQWNLVCDESWKVSFISTIIMAGYLVGSIVSGICSDRLVDYNFCSGISVELVHEMRESHVLLMFQVW